MTARPSQDGVVLVLQRTGACTPKGVEEEDSNNACAVEDELPDYDGHSLEKSYY